MTDYASKPADYYGHCRKDLIDLVPAGAGYRVLEVGAGKCATLAALKKMGLAGETVAVENILSEPSDESRPYIDKFLKADIESDALGIPDGYFDVIICGDVLEHLVDPWRVVKQLKRYLVPDGVLIASIPNFLYYKAFARILFKQDFAYQADGVLDRTHLRFFCRKNVASLFSENGYVLRSVLSNLDWEKWSKKRLLIAGTFGLLEDFLALRYYVVASPNS